MKLTPKQKADDLINRHGLKIAVIVAKEICHNYITEDTGTKEDIEFWTEVRLALLKIWTGDPIICFQCKEPLTSTNRGMIINEGTEHQMAQCNDCHLNEYGYAIMTSSLYPKP